MICDLDTLLCEVPIGALAIVIALAGMGISVTLYGAAEDVQRWWNERRKDDSQLPH